MFTFTQVHSHNDLQSNIASYLTEMHVGISRLFLQGCGICRVNSEYQASPRGQTGDKARDKGAHFTTDKPSWYCMAWLQLVSYPDPPPMIAISANQIVPPKCYTIHQTPFPLRGLKGGSGYEISLVLVWLQWATPPSLRSSSLIVHSSMNRSSPDYTHPGQLFGYCVYPS